MADEKITVLAILKAKAGSQEKLKAMAQSLIEPTRAEAECISYDLHQDTAETTRLMFYENWRSKQALDRHIQMPHLQDFLAKSEALLAGPLDVTIWKKLS